MSLESPPAQPPQTGPHGEKLAGMPKFHDPAPYDFDERTGYRQIFDTKSLAGWDADPTIWHVEDGIMVGETLEGKPRGNNYIVYRGDKARDFDLKLRMKIEKGGGRLLVPSQRADCVLYRPVVLGKHHAGHSRLSRPGNTGATRSDQSSRRQDRRQGRPWRLCKGQRME